MGDQGDQLAARLVDRLERFDPCLGLGLLAAFLDDAGQQVGDRPELGDVGIAEVSLRLGLDVEDADDLVVPGQRDRQHRGDEAALVDATDPQEAGVGLDVTDDRGSTVGRHATGNALAERDAGTTDLEPIQAVRGGEGQVRSVAIEQVERGDVGVEDIAGPVDDRLEKLIPGPRRGRQAGDLVEEAKLLELVVGARRRRRPRSRLGRRLGHRIGPASRDGAGTKGRHGDHHTSLRKVAGQNSCGTVAAEARNGRAEATW